MGKPIDREMREERGMDNAPQCLRRGYIVMAASLAQNNPDSEYIQYSTWRGAECELATESAWRIQYKGGACMHAANAPQLRSTTQPVGQPILTWIVK